MSVPTNPTIPSVIVEDEEIVQEKPTRIKRGVAFLKTHKKTTLAVVFLTGLVAGGVAASRIKASPVDSLDPIEDEENEGFENDSIDTDS